MTDGRLDANSVRRQSALEASPQGWAATRRDGFAGRAPSLPSGNDAPNGFQVGYEVPQRLADDLVSGTDRASGLD